MGSSVNRLGALSVVGLLLVAGWTIAPASGTEPVMCPPVTIDDLLEEEKSDSEAQPGEAATDGPPHTDPPPATDVTQSPTPTSTVPDTAAPAPTTTAPTTTTSDALDTAGETSTTAPPRTSASSRKTAASATTTTEGGTSTTAPPDSTPTTRPPASTTTAPQTTVTTSAPQTTAPPPTTTTTPPPTTTTAPSEPACDVPFTYPMVFPLAGAGSIGSPFGAARDGGARLHQGNDIAAPTMQPVVAVAAGTVSRIAGDTGISGYRVHIRHDDGWSSLYIHLNNDTAGTDDGNGIGIRPDLTEGDRVEAGELIGWNGDSGNAESTVPHLHFELRDPAGEPVDPRASLQAAGRPSGERFSGPFSDLAPEADTVEPLVLLLSRGMPTWCGDGWTACPDEPAGAEDVSAWLEALSGLPATECESGCDGVTEADLARAVAWDLLRDAFGDGAWLTDGIPDSAWSTPPRQPPARPGDLALLDAHHILGGTGRCLSLPAEDGELTRRQAAAAVALYSGWTEVANCPTNSRNR